MLLSLVLLLVSSVFADVFLNGKLYKNFRFKIGIHVPAFIKKKQIPITVIIINLIIYKIGAARLGTKIGYDSLESRE